MSVPVSPFRIIFGNLLALDANGDLLTSGSKIYYNYAGGQATLFDLTSGGGGGGPAGPPFAVNVADSPGTGPINDYDPVGFVATTTSLSITAHAGDTTINGLAATGFTDGMQILIDNPSAADNVIFSHLAGGSAAANRFSNSNGDVFVLPPFTAAILVRLHGKWVFV